MLLRSLKLSRLLSFGPDAGEVELGPLNLLIGPNGSGKSNFLEAIGLLHAAPGDLARVVREGGGVGAWLWQGEPGATAEIEAVLEPRRAPAAACATASRSPRSASAWSWSTSASRARSRGRARRSRRSSSAMRAGGRCCTSTGDRVRGLASRTSTLSDRSSPNARTRTSTPSCRSSATPTSRSVSTASGLSPRRPQAADLPSTYLLPDARNLGLILNRLRRDVPTKRSLVEALQQCFPGITDFSVQIDSATVQIFLEEERWSLPATRLSDGTMRWLALVALLVDPKPGPLIVIEEPELGLHPDLIRGLAELLRRASERTQLIVTTHSTALLDAFSDDPGVVLVCEREQGSTTLRRLERDTLVDWLKEYSLGELWTKGELGGVRW